MNNRPSHALSIPILIFFINPVIFFGVVIFLSCTFFQVLNHFNS